MEERECVGTASASERQCPLSNWCGFSPACLTACLAYLVRELVSLISLEQQPPPPYSPFTVPSATFTFMYLCGFHRSTSAINICTIPFEFQSQRPKKWQKKKDFKLNLSNCLLLVQGREAGESVCVLGEGGMATKANLANDSKAAYNEIVRMISEDLRNCMEISPQNWLPLILLPSLSLSKFFPIHSLSYFFPSSPLFLPLFLHTASLSPLSFCLFRMHSRNCSILFGAFEKPVALQRR